MKEYIYFMVLLCCFVYLSKSIYEFYMFVTTSYSDRKLNKETQDLTEEYEILKSHDENGNTIGYQFYTSNNEWVNVQLRFVEVDCIIRKVDFTVVNYKILRKPVKNDSVWSVEAQQTDLES